MKSARGVWLPWLILGISLLVTYGVWQESVTASQRDVHERFAVHAHDISAAIAERVSDYHLVLRGGLGLFAAAAPVTRESWRNYVQALDLERLRPGITGVGFSLHIDPRNLDSHLQQVRAEGFPEYNIRPPGARAEYTSIILLEPFNTRNQRAFGYDMSTEATRRVAMEHARDTGETTLSGKVILVQETNQDLQYGCLMYLPVYRKGAPLYTVADHRAALVGYVYSPFRMGDFTQGVLANELGLFRVQLYDGSSGDASTLLSDTQRDAPEGTSALVSDQVVDLPGRQWLVRVSSLPAFEQAGQDRTPRTVLGSGLIISFLLFGVLHLLARTGVKAEALAKEMTLALRQSQAMLLSVTEGTTDAVYVKDLHGRYLQANDSTCQLLGKTKEEVIGNDDWALFPPDDAKWLMEKDRWAMDSGVTQTYEEVLSIHGSTRVFLATKGPVHDAQGNLAGLFGIARDITERKRLEKDLVRTQRLRVATELSAGICHNLNNLLTGVLTPADLLQMSSDDPKVKRLAGMIVESGTRAAELVHRLHLSVRGRSSHTLAPVALNHSIEEVVEMTRPRWKDEPEAKGRKIEVHTALAAVPAIKGAPSELNDLLVNLFLNAVDAMPEGGQLAISTALEGEFVRLDVTDTGIGMDEATRLRVFEPFFTTKMDVGSGLGLSTLYNSVIQWGGTAEVKSTVGKGTTFTLRLPVWQEAAPAPTASSTAVDSRPGRVLVVEDDPVVGRILTEVLGIRHQVEVFTDGGQALEQCGAGKYDVAIIDLGMPGIPGDQVAQRLLAIDPAVGRILLSGWALDQDDPRRGLFDFALQKPLRDLRAFTEVVAQAMVLRDQRQR